LRFAPSIAEHARGIRARHRDELSLNSDKIAGVPAAQQRNERCLIDCIPLAHLPARVALLDCRGVIVEVNTAWREFAAQSGFQGADPRVGTNYLEVV
jgi:hypothetical protein